VGLIKQRVARPGQGRSGGYRTLFAHQTNKRVVFVYGFAKNERDNIDVDEVKYWRGVARALLAMTEIQLQMLIEQRELMEVNCDDET
jgi:hypothetical protein